MIKLIHGFQRAARDQERDVMEIIHNNCQIVHTRINASNPLIELNRTVIRRVFISKRQIIIRFLFEIIVPPNSICPVERFRNRVHAVILI